MIGLQSVIALLEDLAVRTHGGRTECHVCGAFTVADELHHNTNCRYVEQVKLLARIDPRSRIEVQEQ